MLPLLTPSCVTIFNRTYGHYLEGYRPVDKEVGRPSNGSYEPDLLAEAAFEAFRLSIVLGCRTREVVEVDDRLDRAWGAAEASISMHRNIRSRMPPAVGSYDRRYLAALGRRYEAFAELYPINQADFSPRIDGCGILGSCQGDIAVGETLVEVKTVDRNFSSKDIRQTIIYLALDYLSGARRWKAAILFNPKRSFIAKFDPNEFILYASAGRSVGQVYREIESLLLHRDFFVEHKF